MRAALYARYSSDRQNEASARDQLDRCRRFAADRGWDVRAEYSDEAISGASLDRPGVTDLRACVEAGRVDVVLVESLDRLSRTTSEAMGLIERFAFRGVGVVGIADGVNTLERGGTLVAGIRATLAAEYLRDLSDKTRRGMAGRARAGMSTGCPPYGYRSVPTDAGVRIEIDPVRAAVVRRIFALFAAGWTARSIANALNEVGIDSPRARPNRRGSGWMHTSIRAVLRNERYAGRWTFGLRRWVKEPGKAGRVVRPGPDPQVAARPDLAIVDASTWETVAIRFQPGAPKRRRVCHLLSGVLCCGVCETTMTIHGGGRYYVCARAKAGTCSSTRSIKTWLVKRAVVEGIGAVLAECSGRVVELAAEELDALRDDAERDAVAARLQRCEDRIGRLVVAVADGSPPAAVLSAIRDMEGQATALRATLAGMDAAGDEEPITVEEVTAAVQDVAAGLDGDPQVGREVLRDLLDRGRLLATPDAWGWTVTGYVDPMRVLDRPPPAEDGSRAGGTVPTKMVAGAGYVRSRRLLEPVTWRVAG